MPSYRQRSSLPAWYVLDADRRILASFRAAAATDVRAAIQRAAANEAPDGPGYFTRVLRDAQWIHRAPPDIP